MPRLLSIRIHARTVHVSKIFVSAPALVEVEVRDSLLHCKTPTVSITIVMPLNCGISRLTASTNRWLVLRDINTSSLDMLMQSEFGRADIQLLLTQSLTST